ncbi:CHC2 zinc finger domain-containing protein [Clostridium perfringens]|uniref:CHC2 zinc finger domain-containing protein n=1 Tax=Clostridium perfringens TaxID=1502 RepID=UPI0039EBD23C
MQITEQDYLNLLNKYNIQYKVEPKSIKVICPFHDDHNHSMAINRDKLFWKCFKDGKAGEDPCVANSGIFNFYELKEMLFKIYGY